MGDIHEIGSINTPSSNLQSPRTITETSQTVEPNPHSAITVQSETTRQYINTSQSIRSSSPPEYIPPPYAQIQAHENVTSRLSPTIEPIFRPLPRIHQNAVMPFDNVNSIPEIVTDVSNPNNNVSSTNNPSNDLPSEHGMNNTTHTNTVIPDRLAHVPVVTSNITPSHSPSNLRRYSICRALLFDCCATHSIPSNAAHANASARAAMRYGAAVMVLGAACVVVGIFMTLVLK